MEGPSSSCMETCIQDLPGVGLREMRRRGPSCGMETHIQDLPDVCWQEILSRIGNPPMPIQLPPGSSPQNSPVSHPLQCLFVCKQWSRVVAGGVTTLTLKYRGPDFESVCAKVATMEGLRELHLESNEVPLASMGPLPGVLRSLDWAHGWPERPYVFRHLTALEALTVRDSSTTRRLPECLGRLPNLLRLQVTRMHGLLTLPDLIGELTNLQVLKLTRCPALRALPHSFCELRNLRSLELEKLDQLEKFPFALDKLTNLQAVRIAGCPAVEDFPFVYHLPQLHTLEVEDCHRMKGPSKHFGRLQSLKVLRLGLPLVTSFHEAVADVCLLEKLVLKCPELSRLPARISLLCRLEELLLCNCKSLERLPRELGRLSELKKLVIVSCPVSLIPDSLGALSNLELLCLRHCNLLTALPESIKELTALKVLHVTHCSLLEKLPESVRHLTQLERLECSSSILPPGVPARVWVDTKSWGAPGAQPQRVWEQF